jgi:hypothetical protein
MCVLNVILKWKVVTSPSGAARFLDAWVYKSQWLPLTQIMKLKKSHSFTEFPFICLSSLKYVEGRILVSLTLFLP